MDKRYQVFVSSTYLDLQEERQEVIYTLMKMDCFPAGMELFPTADEEQWAFIKKIIDESDYYIVVVGARYGSMASGESISYTEKEFDYAIESGKTILVFLHNDPDDLPARRTDQNDELREALNKFRKKLESGRLVSYWDTKDSLSSKVVLGMLNAIKTKPTAGWIKADEIVEDADVLKENRELRLRIEQLLKDQETERRASQVDATNGRKLAGLDEQTIIVFGEKKNSFGLLGTNQDIRHRIKTTWRKVFTEFGKAVENNASMQNLQQTLSASLAKKLTPPDPYGQALSTDTYDKIITQFRALGLAKLIRDTSPLKQHTIKLTDLGEETLLDTLAEKI